MEKIILKLNSSKTINYTSVPISVLSKVIKYVEKTV